jgi:hypothetical protein
MLERFQAARTATSIAALYQELLDVSACATPLIRSV